jgi:hypothetical protein
MRSSSDSSAISFQNSSSSCFVQAFSRYFSKRKRSRSGFEDIENVGYNRDEGKREQYHPAGKYFLSSRIQNDRTGYDEL